MCCNKIITEVQQSERRAQEHEQIDYVAQEDPHREACGATNLEHMRERKINSPDSGLIVFEAPGTEVKHHAHGGEQCCGLNHLMIN